MNCRRDVFLVALDFILIQVEKGGKLLYSIKGASFNLLLRQAENLSSSQDFTMFIVSSKYSLNLSRES